jgi:hypothetical protein
MKMLTILKKSVRLVSGPRVAMIGFTEIHYSEIR